ncbi:MAG: hypothetical protein P9E88_06005 [Candidatus Competibacter sp.]|nr:hypothetical protein [Candidatus Competibacter sp.]
MPVSKTTVLIAGLIAAAAAFAYWPYDKSPPSERYRTQVVDRGDIVHDGEVHV